VVELFETIAVSNNNWHHLTSFLFKKRFFIEHHENHFRSVISIFVFDILIKSNNFLLTLFKRANVVLYFTMAIAKQVLTAYFAGQLGLL